METAIFPPQCAATIPELPAALAARVMSAHRHRPVRPEPPRAFPKVCRRQARRARRSRRARQSRHQLRLKAAQRLLEQVSLFSSAIAAAVMKKRPPSALRLSLPTTWQSQRRMACRTATTTTTSSHSLYETKHSLLLIPCRYLVASLRVSIYKIYFSPSRSSSSSFVILFPLPSPSECCHNFS
jgi:hypothetical protein